MKERRYGGIRAAVFIQDVVGGLFIVVGALYLLASVADRNPLGIPGGIGLIIGGILIIGVAQALTALADIAQDTSHLPEILTQLRRATPDPAPEALLLPERPTPSLEPTGAHRGCPKCGHLVQASKPICSECGTRVYFSRPT